MSADARPRWLIFGVGNPSRGDDALGPALIERLEAETATADLPVAVTLLTDFQHQVEHALDLAGVDAVIFVDASVAAAPPFTLTPLVPAFDATHSSHALSAACVLAVAAQLGRTPPPAWMLAIAGETFELGAPISVAAAAHLAAAGVYLSECLRAGFIAPRPEG